jgi:hypothetical protein
MSAGASVLSGRRIQADFLVVRAVRVEIPRDEQDNARHQRPDSSLGVRSRHRRETTPAANGCQTEAGQLIDDTSPTWAPGDAQIAFASHRPWDGPSDYDIWAVNSFNIDEQTPTNLR